MQMSNLKFDDIVEVNISSAAAIIQISIALEVSSVPLAL